MSFLRQFDILRHSKLSGVPRGSCLLLAAWLAIGIFTSSSLAAFTIGQNFTGSNFNQSGFIPPDTMGGVGPNHIVEILNGRYAVYSKTGVLQPGSSSLNQFWISAGVAPSGNFAFDPRVIYDQYSGRWFAAAVDNAGAANNYLVAVSNSSDPTAGWSGYKIDSDANNSHWADYPMLGLNRDVVTVSANMFPLGAGSTDTSFIVIDKSSLIGGAPITTKIENAGLGNTGFAPQPAWDQDNNNLPQKILSAFNKGAGSLKTSSIQPPLATPTLNTPGGFITVTARSSPPTIDQPTAAANIEAGDSRFSGNVIQQLIPGRVNPSLWAVHGVEISGRAAIEWYEIDATTNLLLQSGTISHASLAFNYPSIAVNDFGDVVIGFSGADPNTFMSTYFVGGTTTAGVTTFGPATQTKPGVARYQRLDSINRNRWGDYSATVVDPANPLHFWTFQEWASAQDIWSIQITQIIVPEPAPATWTAVAMIASFLRKRRYRIASAAAPECRC